MAKDKQEILKEAQKLMQKGSFKKAAELYEKVVKEDPPSRLKLATAYQKLGEDAKALDQYYQMSKFYTKGGFYSKSVAVLKQALQITPDKVEIHEELADLHSKLGLFTDAYESYKRVVASYEKAGNLVKAIETVQKMIDLDPDKLSTRVKLAELYMEQGSKENADHEFQSIVDELKGADRQEDMVTVLERWQNFRKDNPTVLRDLAYTHYGLREYKKAVRFFRSLVEVDSAGAADVEVRLALGRSLRYIGETEVAQTDLLWVAQSYAAQGNKHAADNIYNEILEFAPGNLDAQRALGISGKTAAPPPPPPRAAAAPPPKAAPPPPKEEPLSLDLDETPQETDSDLALDLDSGEEPEELSLDLDEEPAPPPPKAAPSPPAAAPAASPAAFEMPIPSEYAKAFTECDIYIKYGLKDKAIDHLTALIDEDPACAAIYHKVADIRLKYQEPDEACKVLHRYGFYAASNGRIAEANQTLNRIVTINPRFGPAEEIRSLLRVLEERAGGADSSPAPQTAPEEEGLSIDIDVDETPVETPPEEDREISFGMASDAEESAEESASARTESAHEIELDVEGGFGDAASSGMDGEIEVEIEASHLQPAAPPTDAGLDISIDMDEPPVAAPATIGASPDSELEIDFDRDAASLPESQPQPQPVPVPAAHGKLDLDDEDIAFDIPMAEEPAAAVEEAPEEASMEEPVAVAATEGELPDISDELQEVDFYIEQGLDEEAVEFLTDLFKKYPGHPDIIAKFTLLGEEPPALAAAPPPAKPILAPRAEMEPEGFDLAAALADEEEGGTAPEVESGFDERLDKKTRIVAEGVSDKDVETHFDLGMAYREMDMLDEAVKEFEFCKQSPAKRIEAMSLIAQLHAQMGFTERAIAELEAALEANGTKDTQRVGLFFSLGEILEQSGEIPAALERYKAAYAIDPQFGDLGRRIANLGGSGTKKKVSFI